MNPVLVGAIIESLPDIIKGVKELFKKNNPNAPVPTETEIMFAFNQAFISSLTKDDAYLNAHKND